MYPDADSAPLERRILPHERAGAVLEVILCSGFPTQILLIAVLHGFGIRPLAEGGGLSPLFVFSVSLLDTVLVLGIIYMLLRAHGESVREVLLGRVRLLKEALVGIGLIPLVFFIVAVVLLVILTWAPHLRNVPRNPLEDMLTTRSHAMIFAVVAMIAGGVREEVQRGFIVHRFGQYLGGRMTGVIVHSTFFGLGHYEQGYDAMMATATLGIFWGVVYVRRNSIVAPVVSHAGFNLAQVIKFVTLR